MEQVEGNLNLWNGIASIFWFVFCLASIYRQKIPYRTLKRPFSTLWVERNETPRLFWLLVAGMAALTLWTGAAFALHRA